MLKRVMRILNVFVCAVFVFQSVGCGTILYPERKGQRAGRIDMGVALLDGIGLLFFLLPGVIAFAVDFSNGTIYLPGTATSALDVDDFKTIKFNPKKTRVADIERIIQAETGHTVKWGQDGLKTQRLASTDEMIVRFEQALPELSETPKNRTASIR